MSRLKFSNIAPFSDQPLATNVTLSDGAVNVRCPLNLPTASRYVVARKSTSRKVMLGALTNRWACSQCLGTPRTSVGYLASKMQTNRWLRQRFIPLCSQPLGTSRLPLSRRRALLAPSRIPLLPRPPPALQAPLLSLRHPLPRRRLPTHRVAVSVHEMCALRSWLL